MNPVPVEVREAHVRQAHLRDYWKVVWTGRYTIAAVFLLVVAATAVWTFLQTPVYRATAVVEVQPQSRQIAAGQDVSGLGAAGYGWFAEEKYHNTQVEIIKSRDVAQRAVERLQLATHPDFAELDDPIEAFRRRIQVDPRRDTGLIEISIAGTDPDEITQWVNAVADLYVKRNLQKAKENMHESISAIQDQLVTFRKNLVQAEEQRVSTLATENLFNADNQADVLKQNLEKYNSALTDVRLELNEVQGTLNLISALAGGGGDLLSVPDLAADEALAQLERDKVDLERRVESAKVQLRPGHPEYGKLGSELSKVQQRIRDRVEVIVTALHNRLEALREQEQFLGTKIREAEEFSLKIAKATSAYDIVKTDAEAQKTVLELISGALNEVRLGAQLMSNNVSLLDTAMPPRWPIKPRRKLNLVMGAMLGMCLGLATVFFLDYLDNTFRTPDDIEKQLGLPVLGVIPRLGEEGVAGRAIREAYQSLRTSVIFCSKNRERRLVLVTSTGPQEGKSSTSANLARTLAQAGERVLLIDCDLRRPTQHVHLAAERDHGLTNYLAAADEHADWRSFVKPAGVPNLHLMSCGPIPPSPPELLGSERFRSLVATAREQYDWVLLDSPPAATLADAPLLAEAADMVILVIQHNRTDRDLVAKSLQRLRAVNPLVVGAVLNNVDIDRSYNRDYYYAGYYYYGDEERKGKKRRRIETEVGVG